MNRANYERAIKAALAAPNGQPPGWNSRFRAILKDHGLRISGARGERYYFNAPHSVAGEADGWPSKSFIVPW